MFDCRCLTLHVLLDLFIYLCNQFSIKTWLGFIYFLIPSSTTYMLLHGFHLDSLTKYRGWFLKDDLSGHWLFLLYFKVTFDLAGILFTPLSRQHFLIKTDKSTQHIFMMLCDSFSLLFQNGVPISEALRGKVFYEGCFNPLCCLDSPVPRLVRLWFRKLSEVLRV